MDEFSKRLWKNVWRGVQTASAIVVLLLCIKYVIFVYNSKLKLSAFTLPWVNWGLGLAGIVAGIGTAVLLSLVILFASAELIRNIGARVDDLEKAAKKVTGGKPARAFPVLLAGVTAIINLCLSDKFDISRPQVVFSVASIAFGTVLTLMMGQKKSKKLGLALLAVMVIGLILYIITRYNFFLDETVRKDWDKFLAVARDPSGARGYVVFLIPSLFVVMIVVAWTYRAPSESDPPSE